MNHRFSLQHDLEKGQAISQFYLHSDENYVYRVEGFGVGRTVPVRTIHITYVDRKGHEGLPSVIPMEKHLTDTRFDDSSQAA